MSFSEIVTGWQTPNYVNPITRGPELWIVIGIFLFLASLAVGVRLYTRIFVRHWFGFDDALIIFSLFAAYAVTATVIVGNVKYGWNRHFWDVPESDYTPSAKVTFVARILWGVASTSVRLSVLCLYYRLINHTHYTHYRWVLHLVTTFAVGMLFVFIFSGIFTCKPISANWDWPTPPGSKCVDIKAMITATSILNIVCEFLVALLPIAAVFHIGVDERQRWTVVSLLSMGFVVAIIGCIRMHFLNVELHTLDVTWYSTPNWVCSLIEIDVALVCACLPPLKPVITRLWSRWVKGKGTQRQLSVGKSGVVTSLHTDAPILNSNAVESWAATTRAVDLEGIGQDGMGYTIIITGPKHNGSNTIAKRVQGLLRRRRKESLLEPEAGMEQRSKGGSPPSHGIMASTTVRLQEQFNDSTGNVSETRSEYMNRVLNEEYMELEMDQAAIGLSDWSLLKVQTLDEK